MDKRNVLYDVLEARVTALAETLDDNVPYHRFSRRYMRREKTILKAYLKSMEKQEPLERTYRRVSLGNNIKFAAITVLAVLALAGSAVYITHNIGGMTIKEYDTHSLAFAADIENAPKTLESRYAITYDLSGWSKEIMLDDTHDHWEIYKYDDKYISFSYSVKSGYQGARLNTEGSVIKETMIDERPAISFTSPDGIECLVWDNGDYIMEFLYKNISPETALEILSSIEKQNTSK